MNDVWIALGLTLLAGMATAIGSVIAFTAKRTNYRLLSVATGFSAGDYLDATRGSQDHWWTPMNMALSLDQSRPEFELYIQKEMLQKRIEQGTLFIAGEQGKPSQVAAGDIKVRLNHQHKVKADKLQGAVITAFFLGGSMALLVVGLVRFFMNKKIYYDNDNLFQQSNETPGRKK